MDYRYGSHTVFKIEYHFVFVTKYRYQVLQGDVGYKARDLIKQTCDMHEIEIKKESVRNSTKTILPKSDIIPVQ